MFLYLFIFFLHQKLGCVHCAVTLSQPPATAAMLGSSVNLNCSMQLNGVKLDRVNLYWLIPDANNRVKEYLYPRQKRISPRSNNSRLVYPEFTNDLSLSIDKVQLPYTDTYICETSLLVGATNTRTAGKGTYLLVYDEFTTFMNLSDIFCKVKVQAHKNVDLLWESQDQDYNNAPSSVDPASDNSYWIISVLTADSQRCRHNTTFTCKLRYLRQSLVERSIEVACAGDPQASLSPPHPIVLYISILGNSLLILIIIIVGFCWMKKKKRNRRVQVAAPCAGFSAPAKRKYNG